MNRFNAIVAVAVLGCLAILSVRIVDSQGIADEAGGEYFALRTQAPVSFKPYLDRLQRIFSNQYFLVFRAVPRKNVGLQRVSVSTEVPNADLASANNVWVAAA